MYANTNWQVHSVPSRWKAMCKQCCVPRGARQRLSFDQHLPWAAAVVEGTDSGAEQSSSQHHTASFKPARYHTPNDVHTGAGG